MNLEIWWTFVCLVVLQLPLQSLPTAHASPSRPVCRSRPLTNKGKTFIVTFPVGYERYHSRYTVYIAAEAGATHVVINSSLPDINNDSIISGPAVRSYNIGTQILQTINGKIRQYLHISANRDIAVYVMGSTYGAASAYTILPTFSLAARYMIGLFKPSLVPSKQQLIMTAIQPNTTFSIDSTVARLGNVTLETFVSYSILTTSDLTGTIVTASNPVSVVSAIGCINIPNRVPYCDAVADSPLPVDSWGTQYIVPPMPPRKAYLVRILVANTTEIRYFNGTTNKTTVIDRKKPLDLIFGTDPTVITAVNPIMVVQYGLGQDYDDITGDPSMSSLPALSNFGNNYVFPAPSNPKETYINTLIITIRRSFKLGLLLDGSPLTGATFITAPQPLADYDIAYIDITGSTHTLSHTNTRILFGAMLYGRANAIGYSFPLGLTLSAANDSCINNGYCDASDTCVCRWGFSGELCEKADLHPDLKPELHAKETDFKRPLSWYESPSLSYENHVCFVKVSLKNSPLDTVLTATSYNNENVSYGNYSSGPIDRFGQTNATERVACLEVKCPRLNSQTNKPSTFVEVSVLSTAGVCYVNYTNGYLSNITVLPTTRDHDKLKFQLAAGNNYGPLFGVYMSMGQRQKAKYAAEYKCLSGRDYIINVINPSKGRLAEYVCA